MTSETVAAEFGNSPEPPELNPREPNLAPLPVPFVHGSAVH